MRKVLMGVACAGAVVCLSIHFINGMLNMLSAILLQGMEEPSALE